MRTGAKNVRARPFLQTKINFRDWSLKDEILIDYISIHKKNFSNIGACTCAQEPKTYVRGRFQPHRGVTVRTRAENIHVPLFSLSHGRFLIVKCILESCHKQKKYSLTIYLIVGCILSKLSQGFCMYVFYVNLI